MYKLFVLLACAVVVCRADAPEPPKVYCGEIPNKLYNCIRNPVVVPRSTSVACDRSISECDRMKCLFKESRWLTDSKVDKKKVSDYFDQYAKDFPEWSPAVQHLKTACLAQDLPAQGVDTNCPAYDISHCIFTSFIRNATPSQWSTSGECVNARQFAGACPVCPSDCFAPAVPLGSCNACLSLPRTP